MDEAKLAVMAEVTQADRAMWLRDLLLDRIQFHIWSDATAEDVEKVVNGLSDSDEYDANVGALVRMPKWASPCEAQAAVDERLAYHRIAHQSRPLGVEREAGNSIAASIKAIERAMKTVDPDYPMATCLKSDLRVLLTLTDASDEGREAVRREAFEEAALIAETLRIGGGTLSSWVNTNESPMGATQRHIATAIRARAVPPSDS